MTDATKLSLRSLGKRFGDLEALRDINAEIARGEFISLVGPSGCAVLLDGRPIRGPGGDRGFVFQNDNLLPWRSVFENAMIGPEVAGRVGAAEKSRTAELLRLVGLEGFEN